MSGTEAAVKLQVMPLPGVVPLDLQIGADVRRSIPEAMVEPCFGQPVPTTYDEAHHSSDTPAMQTYAVLDAARIAQGADLIEESGLKWRCLYQGPPAKTLRDVAPYLVELAPASTLTRLLFTYDQSLPAEMSSLHLWHKKPGIFLRARAPFDPVWRHLRRFTRVRDESGKWYYFRFYEPLTIGLHLSRSKRFAQSFLFERSGRIPLSVLLLNETQSHAVSLDQSVLTQMHGAAFSIGSEDRAVFRDATLWSRAGKLLARLEEKFNVGDGSEDRMQQQRRLMESMLRMSDYGFKQPVQQDRMATWDFFFGPDFERQDPEGTLFAICSRTDERSSDRFAAFTRRMSELAF